MHLQRAFAPLRAIRDIKGTSEIRALLACFLSEDPRISWSRVEEALTGSLRFTRLWRMEHIKRHGRQESPVGRSGGGGHAHPHTHTQSCAASSMGRDVPPGRSFLTFPHFGDEEVYHPKLKLRFNFHFSPTAPTELLGNWSFKVQIKAHQSSKVSIIKQQKYLKYEH